MAISDDNAGIVGERYRERKSPVVNAASVAYTIVPADSDIVRVFQAAGATTITVPTDAAVAAPGFPLGTRVVVVTTGAGGITIAGAGVTFTGAALTGAQNVSKEIVKIGVNAWFCLR
jgi:hypothetical protein